MKRLITIIIAFILLVPVLAGCAQRERRWTPEPAPETTNQQQPEAESAQEPEEDFEKISITATIFPIYDWFRQIIGEENLSRFELTLLLDSGIDTHSFNPSVSDVLKIQTSDVFFYVGGYSDNWVNDVISDANADIMTESLLDILGDFVLPTPEFYFDEDYDEEDDLHHHHHHQHNEEGDDHDDYDDARYDYDEAYDHDEHTDEHVWLSLHNAELFCIAIADILSQLDPANKQIYNDNLDAYVTKLGNLDSDFMDAVDAANVTTLVFADRFPFQYMMEDYHLDFYAAFSGCAAEAEASFATIISLAEIVDSNDLNFVIVTETSNQDIANQVIRNTKSGNQRILVLDAMKMVTQSDIQNGATYLSIMKNNLTVLKEALTN